MIQELISRARRRLIVHEALSQLALAASLAVGALALLLLFGTVYLDWWSVALIAVLGLGFGTWRVFKHVPREYAVALQLDQSAGLHDSLSTALHFTGNANQPFRDAQYRQAEAIASGVDLETTLPFSMPRALYAMAALCLLATVLFAVRYRMTGTLDLRAPLTQVLFEDQQNPALAKGGPKPDAKKTPKKMTGMESLMAKLGVNLNQENTKNDDAIDKAVEQALRAPGAPGEGDKKGQAPGSASKDGKSAAAGEQGEKGDPLDGGKEGDKSGKEGDSGSQAGKEDSKSGDKGNSKQGNSGDNASLLSKIKDAVSNMMSKAKDSNSANQKGGQQQGSDQQAKQEKGGGEKGKSGQSQQNQNQQQASSQEADPNGDGQEGQQSQGKSGAKDSDQKASSQPGSGIGHQDGAKDMKAAEQLKAMGKLSEIIGKRASTVSGETSVEVESGSQQLRTAYTNSKASHAETDGDVNRDEVPVAMQQYVQQYFQQVRKPDAAAAAKAKAAGKASPTAPIAP